NNEYANGLAAPAISELGEFGTCFDYPAIVAKLEKKLGRRLKHSEVSAWFAGQAGRFISEKPGKFVGLLVKKLCLLLGPVEIGHNKVIYYERKSSLLLRYLPANFALIMSLAVVGLGQMLFGAWRGRDEAGRSPQRGEVALLVGLLAGMLLISILPFFVSSRYRLPVIPLLLLGGAYGLVGLWRKLSARNWPAVACWAGVLVAAYAGVALMPYRHQPRLRLAKWHCDRGLYYFQSGQSDQYAQAESHFRKAIQADSKDADPHYALGVLLHK
ncbi:unnamed protein product, partial [marine sediment metagenome]